MRTIEKILEYNLTNEEKEALVLWGIINGCWGKWWFNFDKFIDDNICFIPWFDQKKKKKFFADLKEICFEHDCDFRFKKWFLYSNFKFVRKIYLLITRAKKKWAKKKHAFVWTLTLFILMNRYGKEFYNPKK